MALLWIDELKLSPAIEDSCCLECVSSSESQNCYGRTYTGRCPTNLFDQKAVLVDEWDNFGIQSLVRPVNKVQVAVEDIITSHFSIGHFHLKQTILPFCTGP
jgi:hypothetical protein